jgi:hypothetical protein
MKEPRSIYAKEVRTNLNVIYANMEVIYDSPDFIKDLIHDAITVKNDNLLEYVSKSSIVSIEMYKERTDK